MTENRAATTRFLLPAGDGNLFAPDAFTQMVGTLVPIRIGDLEAEARVLSASVVMDGQYAEITLRLDVDEHDVADGKAVAVRLPPVDQQLVQLSIEMRAGDGTDANR